VVQATDIALDAYVENEQALVWANRLGDGAPLSGAQITLYPSKAQAASQADGVATLPLPASSNESAYLIARLGEDAALLPGGGYYGWWGGSWSQRNPGAPYRWYVFDDRGMYRPERPFTSRVGCAAPASPAPARTWRCLVQAAQLHGNCGMHAATSCSTANQPQRAGWVRHLIRAAGGHEPRPNEFATDPGWQSVYAFLCSARIPAARVRGHSQRLGRPHFVGEHAQLRYRPTIMPAGRCPTPTCNGP
jgi:hypothetical protein